MVARMENEYNTLLREVGLAKLDIQLMACAARGEMPTVPWMRQRLCQLLGFPAC